MATFVKKSTKKSLLAMLRKANEITPRLLARLFEGVMFKDEYDTASGGGGSFLRTDGTADSTGEQDFTANIKTDVVSESTAATGVTVDGVLLKDSEVTTDVINEKTAAAGVTIDGGVLKDGGGQFTDSVTVTVSSPLKGFIASRVQSVGGSANNTMRKARGSVGSETIVNDGDTIGTFRFDGYDGAAWETCARLQVKVDGTPGSGDVPGELLIGTSPGAAGLIDYLKLSPDGLLSFQNSADIAAATNTSVCLSTYTDVKARNTEYNLHGGLDSLDTGSALDSVPTNITVTAGTGKLMVVINAGSDVSGSITVTGTTVDRNTGAETGADTDTLTVDALTTDGSDTDADGNTRHSFTGAYITSKWFKGSVTLSTTDLTLTDVDTYQVAFEQFNDTPSITLDSLDLTALATNSSAWLYAYMYTLEVTGDKCDVTRVASLDLPAAEVSANKYYRLRRGNLATSISGTTDGIWVDMFPGPLANVYWEDINTKVWAKLKHDVYGESS